MSPSSSESSSQSTGSVLGPDSVGLSPWIGRTALLLAALSCLILLLGALAKTAGEAPEGTVSSLLSATTHRRVAEATFLLLGFFAVWVSVAAKRDPVRRVGWIMTVALLAQMTLGTVILTTTVPRWVIAIHASFAPLVVAGMAVMALITSGAWSRKRHPVQDYGWPSLRSLAVVTPVLVFTQVMLGVAFRQQLAGLMPHIIGAMLISLVILLFCAFVLQQCKEHPLLGPAAKGLMALTFVQIGLGMGAFTVRAVPDIGMPALLATTAGHVLVGALVFSASLLLGVLIRRDVYPAAK